MRAPLSYKKHCGFLKFGVLFRLVPITRIIVFGPLILGKYHIAMFDEGSDNIGDFRRSILNPQP